MNYLEARSTYLQSTVLNGLCAYIEVLDPYLKDKSSTSFKKDLTYIRSSFCEKYKFSTCKAKYSAFLIVIKLLIENGHLPKLNNLPKAPRSLAEYDTYKTSPIPIEVADKIEQKISADDSFSNTLDKTCTPEIAKRLKEHVNSFKHKKLHRAPLGLFLEQISAVNSEWHQHPRIIQGELLKFRNSLLDHKQRNTAYGDFQNVKNAISVLIEHRLLPNDTELPGNLRRCVNSEKIRSENPIISMVDIYSQNDKKALIDSRIFLEDLKVEIKGNLGVLVKEAKSIVYEGYHRFLSRYELIKKSQHTEFLAHPEMLVKKKKGSSEPIKGASPFKDSNPQCFENKLALSNHFFSLLVQNIPLPTNPKLKGLQDVLPYLGLTPLVASAMQIIIVEELGINPHSIYEAKVSTNKSGNEFIQVEDEGSVRLRVLKPRARKAHSKKAIGSKSKIQDILMDDINAATCLKIALEMTSQARKVVNQQCLWLCLKPDGAFLPCSTTFQTYFNKIRGIAAASKKILEQATLKKIRISKAILIYLESNGDSLKTANYLGNTVKTTLHRYIPPYITELVYRIKIRSFQYILLYMSVSNERSPSKSLNLSEEEFKSNIKQAFENPDMGGNLYQKLTTPEHDCGNSKVKFFCVSERNISIAIKYVREGADENLKKDCQTALDKISEGPVILKQLLRKAQTASLTQMKT